MSMAVAALEAVDRRATARPSARIVILSGAHLSRNPRVHKEALALGRAGFDVEVLGAWTDAEVAAQDSAILEKARPFRFTPVIDLTRQAPLAMLRRRCHTVMDRAARMVSRSLDETSPWRFGWTVAALARQARTRHADLTIAHLEYGLAAARPLLDVGRRVMVDMEDWYSEDLLPEARQTRPIALLRQLEGDLLRRGAGATCPSKAMSRALADAYNCPPPLPLYNAFPWAERRALDGERRDRPPGGNPTIHWFSQTVGPGRGLEDLFAALPHLGRAVDVHLRGTPVRQFDAWLSATIAPAWRPRVTVHKLVPPNQLLSRIAEHDISFAGEMLFCRSRDLTVTNKILQYLSAGLAVVASDTAGQREVAEQAPGAVMLYPSGDPVALAGRFNDLLNSADRLRAAKDAALRAAKAVFCWERQEDTFLKAVGSALNMQAASVGR